MNFSYFMRMYSISIGLPLVVSIWWIFWYAVAVSGVTGMIGPGESVGNLLIILGGGVFFGLMFGLIFHDSVAVKSGNPVRVQRDVDFDVAVWLKVERFAMGSLFVVSPFLIWFVGKAYLVQGFADSGEYRNMLLGSAEEQSLVLSSTFSYLFYTVVLGPVVFAATFFGVAGFWIHGRRPLLILSAIALLGEQFAAQGRFGLYYLVLLNIFAAWSVRQVIARGYCSLPWAPKVSFLSIVVVVSASAFFLMVRSISRGSDEDDFFDVIYQAIEYHTLAFSLLGLELSNPGSLLNQLTTFGRSSFGGLDEYFALLMRALGFDFQPIRQTVGSYLNFFHFLGARADGTYLFYNAYYTSVYTLYLDAGSAGVFLGGFFWALWCTVSGALFMRNGSALHFTSVLLAFFLGIFSIFQCPLLGTKFWLVAIAIVAAGFYSISKSRERYRHVS